MEFKTRDFRGFNVSWNYVVVNAPVEVSHDPPRPIGIFTPKSQRGKWENEQYSQRSKAINIFKARRKAINVFKHKWNLRQGVFMGPMPYEITWLLMPPWRSHIIHHNQSGFSRPNHKRERGKMNNIHNTVKK